MPIKNDYTGLKLNYLIVLGRAPDHIRPSGERIVRWSCKCICDIIVIKDGSDIGKCLRTGKGCKSCGCKTKEILSKHFTIHGHTKSKFNNKETSREYYTFKSMHSRCDNSWNPSYSNYGGRGITVCERWAKGAKGFKNFLKDMGLKPPGLTLERKNTNGNYEPNNCKWATPKEQLNNTRLTIFLDYYGTSLSLTTWAELLGVKPDTFRCRSQAGWSDIRILETPINKSKPKFYFSPWLNRLRNIVKSERV